MHAAPHRACLILPVPQCPTRFLVIGMSSRALTPRPVLQSWSQHVVKAYLAPSPPQLASQAVLSLHHVGYLVGGMSVHGGNLSSSQFLTYRAFFSGVFAAVAALYANAGVNIPAWFEAAAAVFPGVVYFIVGELFLVRVTHYRDVVPPVRLTCILLAEMPAPGNEAECSGSPPHQPMHSPHLPIPAYTLPNPRTHVPTPAHPSPPPQSFSMPTPADRAGAVLLGLVAPVSYFVFSHLLHGGPISVVMRRAKSFSEDQDSMYRGATMVLFSWLFNLLTFGFGCYLLLGAPIGLVPDIDRAVFSRQFFLVVGSVCAAVEFAAMRHVSGITRYSRDMLLGQILPLDAAKQVLQGEGTSTAWHAHACVAHAQPGGAWLTGFRCAVCRQMGSQLVSPD